MPGKVLNTAIIFCAGHTQHALSDEFRLFFIYKMGKLEYRELSRSATCFVFNKVFTLNIQTP